MLYYANQYVQTKLSVPGGITASDTANITLENITGIDTTNPGIALLDYQNPLDVTKAEWITYTSINVSKGVWWVENLPRFLSSSLFYRFSTLIGPFSIHPTPG